jgi:hypothetical protein
MRLNPWRPKSANLENVRRVDNSHGTHIEPPLDPAWSAEDKLRWKAAVTAFDTGLAIWVEPAEFSINGVPQHGCYCIQVGYSSAAPFDLDSAWTYLNGIETGAHEAVRVGRVENGADR